MTLTLRDGTRREVLENNELLFFGIMGTCLVPTPLISGITLFYKFVYRYRSYIIREFSFQKERSKCIGD